MIKTLILTGLVFLQGLSFAQDIEYAKHVVSTLASAEMAGRGYVNNGDGKAAAFIAAEFEKLKLKKFGNDYYQPLTFPVNTFPGRMELTINGKKLVPGVDFIIDPASGPVSGSFDAVSLSANDLLNDAKWIPVVKKSKGKFIVIESYDKASFNTDQNKTACRSH
ncbi:MAG: hypothetical protein HC859_14725 [Bacteroidia bacterium]|nr:hypothetical protein [Bacteroidia bacterium]